MILSPRQATQSQIPGTHEFAKKPLIVAVKSVLFAALLCGLSHRCGAQEFSKYDKERVGEMWQAVSTDIRKHYYDPKFHGIDLDAKIQATKEAIDKAASLNMALSQIGAALDAFNDSHLFFLPPARPYRHDFGWRLQMIGERCYVTNLRPGSDAELKGVKPGDEVLAINGFRTSRTDLPKMLYVFNTLRPQPALHLTLRDPSGNERQIDVVAMMHQLPKVEDLTNGFGIGDLIRNSENLNRLERARTVELGDDLLILKIPQFFYQESEIAGLIKKARKHKALILDLRGNPGGSIETLKELIGGLFERDIKIGDRVGRESSKAITARGKGKDAFQGKLIVLVDAQSASASEVLARVVQLEKRGVVIGDRSGGRVMEARLFSYKIGFYTVMYYGASITDADLVMTDGKSLEHTGVLPHEVLLPSVRDIAQGFDPVLAHAAELAGVQLTPEAAGKEFPFEWPSD